MDAAAVLREARRVAGLSQATLAARTGTSQATISAYEHGRKEPTVGTLSRLLSATGWKLTAERAGQPIHTPSAAELAAAGSRLVQVLDLAGELPVRHRPTMGFPPLRRLAH